MAALRAEERRFLQTLSRLAYANPFLAERIELEREALGGEFEEAGADWNIHGAQEGGHPNLLRLLARTEAMIGTVRGRMQAGARLRAEERELYEDLVLFQLYHQYLDRLTALVQRGLQDGEGTVPFYDSFRAQAADCLQAGDQRLPALDQLGHILACFFQLRRAFHHIFRNLIGVSGPVIRLRASVWESIFTCDIRRYRRGLFDRMGDVTTLITGPSGTGKELVARAIALSRYIPFDERRRSFGPSPSGAFYPLNLSALSPTLIESELFGHRRGAFTGALQDRPGWFEVCPPAGTVFLDEIGDLAPAIQVKLLRVLQTRTFQRLGDTETRRFQGKIIAATNQDLTRAIAEKRFRADFYYRICSDLIQTPALQEQLRDQPEQLRELVRFLACRVAGEIEGPALAEEVVGWIERHLGLDYPWPGNVRELEQCVRNIMIRRRYEPPRPAPAEPRCALDLVLNGSGSEFPTAEEVLRRYCTLVYAATGSYVETARRLELDRRTVKARIDPELLERMRRLPGA